MSDPVTNAEVEDVLSSIRRLVSEDKRPGPSRSQAPRPSAEQDRLVLTPALRVAESEAEAKPEADPQQDTAEAQRPDRSGPAAPAAEGVNSNAFLFAPDLARPELDEAPPARYGFDEDAIPAPPEDAPAAEQESASQASEALPFDPTDENDARPDPEMDYSDDPYHFDDEDNADGDSDTARFMPTPEAAEDHAGQADEAPDDANTDVQDEDDIRAALSRIEALEDAPEMQSAARATEDEGIGAVTPDGEDAPDTAPAPEAASWADETAPDNEDETARDWADAVQAEADQAETSQAEAAQAAGDGDAAKDSPEGAASDAAARDDMAEQTFARRFESVVSDGPGRIKRRVRSEATEPSEGGSGSLSAKIAALETVIGSISGSYEPDSARGEDVFGSAEPTPMTWEDEADAPRRGARLHALHPRAVADPDEDAEAGAAAFFRRAPAEEAPEPAQAAPATEAAPEQAPQQDAGAPDSAPEAPAAAEATHSDAAEEDHLPEGEEDQLLDEEALREMISEIVRAELQGALGQRITRNVRKLVRREIHRALTAQELE